MKNIIPLAALIAVLIGQASCDRGVVANSVRVDNNAGAQSFSASPAPAASSAAAYDAANLRSAAPTDPLCTNAEPDDRVQEPKVSCDFVAHYLSMRARPAASSGNPHPDFLSRLMEKMGLGGDGAMASFLLMSICHSRAKLARAATPLRS